MDCKEFLERHAPFVDLMCSVQDEREMREHLQQCEGCTRHDTRIRRSLMLVRSLPTIQPSPEFRAKLDARLREERLAGVAIVAPRRRRSVALVAAAAAGIAFAGYVANDLVQASRAADVVMPPVVATLPQNDSFVTVAPAMVATVPTAMSVWPAIMLASQAQVQLVAAELATER
jgi:hypothetical protein